MESHLLVLVGISRRPEGRSRGGVADQVRGAPHRVAEVTSA